LRRIIIAAVVLLPPLLDFGVSIHAWVFSTLARKILVVGSAGFGILGVPGFPLSNNQKVSPSLFLFDCWIGNWVRIDSCHWFGQKYENSGRHSSVDAPAGSLATLQGPF
jgi:hypothetical protein